MENKPVNIPEHIFEQLEFGKYKDTHVDVVRLIDDLYTRIAELESICENNADALAFYDARGKRIAELEEAGRKTLDVLYEEHGRLVVEANFKPLIQALRGEGFKTELADSMERHKELLDRLGEAQSDEHL